MIAVCNPNNPIGAVLSDLEMRWVFKMAEQVGAWVYADEIYRGAVLDDLFNQAIDLSEQMVKEVRVINKEAAVNRDFQTNRRAYHLPLNR